MSDYLNCEMPEDFEVIMVDGTYAEIKNGRGVIFAVNASGDGGFFNHEVEFVRLAD